MRIEAATIESAAVIAKLNETVLQLHCELSPNDFQSATRESLTAELAKLLSEDGAHAFIAWDDNVPVGYCLLKFVEREPNPWTRGCRRLLVDQLSVGAEYRRRRVGTGLMEAAFNFARQQGIHEVTLEYWSTNHAARGFYKALGFVPRTEKVFLKLADA